MDPLGLSLVLLGWVARVPQRPTIARGQTVPVPTSGTVSFDTRDNEMPNKMARYIEWQSGGRLTGRAAYAIGKQNLPEPVAGAEWQIDSQFSAADEILRDPTIKDIFQAVIANGVKVVMWR